MFGIKQLLLLSVLLTFGSCNAEMAPVIGVLAQEAYSIQKIYPDENLYSFIAASYVKFIESAGGRVIPVMIGRDQKYYQNIIDTTNGLLLPGGGVYFNQSHGFADAGQMLYDYAVKINDKGDFYPIWSICLGMELLAIASIGGKDIRTKCSSKKVSLPLDFKPDFESSKLFASAPADILDILSTENVTVNSHGWCFTEKDFRDHGLDKKWRVMSTNLDKYGLEFISTYESYKYPFYGVQFHPEKNVFEFERDQNTLHTHNAIRVSQYFGNFFLQQCRINDHQFPNGMKSKLIYNYSPRYSGILGSIYEQVYLFDKGD